MGNGLDKLIYIYSVDTSSFYNDKEQRINQKILEMKQYKSNLYELIKPLSKFKNESNKILKENNSRSEDNEIKLNELEKDLYTFADKYSIFNKQINEYLFFDEDSNLYKINYRPSRPHR